MTTEKEELELQVSPSRWSRRWSDPNDVIKAHVNLVIEESKTVRDSVPADLGIRYSDKLPKATLDVYGTDLPESSPIFVYVSGGYWQELSADVSAYPVTPMHQNGVVTVVMDYDRAPGGSILTYTILFRAC